MTQKIVLLFMTTEFKKHFLQLIAFSSGLGAKPPTRRVRATKEPQC